jgi:hypothetical protein
VEFFFWPITASSGLPAVIAQTDSIIEFWIKPKSFEDISFVSISSPGRFFPLFQKKYFFFFWVLFSKKYKKKFFFLQQDSSSKTTIKHKKNMSTFKVFNLFFQGMQIYSCFVGFIWIKIKRTKIKIFLLLNSMPRKVDQ